MSETTEAEDDLPSTIGRYKIEGTLGFGAMGAVYRGFDPIIKRPVAVKTIRVDVPRNSPQYQAFSVRFEQEFQISGTLSHPNIVTLFDVGTHRGAPFLAMEYVEGQTIAAMLDAGEKFKPERVLGLVSQVASALDYAHSRGIVHRDIKPSNLIVQEGDKLKVTDFGIAKLVDSDVTQSGALLGTPSYMSPEQAMGEKLDGRSDIFSLGVVAFEMLSGQQPFPGANVTSILYRLVHVDPIEPADLEMNGLVPQKWREVFQKVLAKKPRDRYAKASEFVRDLEFCLGSWFSGLGEETVALDSDAALSPAVASRTVPPAPASSDAGPETRETVVLQTAEEGEEAAATRVLEASATTSPEEETVMLGPAAGEAGTLPGGTVPAVSGEQPQGHSPAQKVVTQPVEVTAPRRVARPLPTTWILGAAAFLFFLAAATLTLVLWQRAGGPPVSAAGMAPSSGHLDAPPPATSGFIRVTSAPAGGTVLVNGEDRGKTPLDLEGIPFGTYEIAVELSGYETQNREVTLAEAGPAAEVAVALARRIPSRGSASFTSEPPGATVMVSGRRLGRTPLRDVALDPGRHRVRMVLDGHEPWSGTVEVVAGHRAGTSARLVPVRQAEAADHAEPGPTPPPAKPVNTARVYENSPSAVDRVARKVSGISPRYPADRAPRLKEGDRVSVTLSFLVSEGGEVEDVQVVESAGRIIDGVVVDAVQTWKYAPAMIRETPVRVKIMFKQTFLGG